MTFKLKMDVRGLVVILALFSLSRGLSPLITWSNRDVLYTLEDNDGIDTITSTLIENEEDIEVVVVFGAGKLSFDDIVKHGSAFSKESSGELNSLKSSLKLSKSQYWTGIRDKSIRWILDLASGMGMQAKYMNQEDLTDSDNIQGVIFVNLEYVDFKSQDNTMGLVMDTIQRSGKSFVAIYTELTSEKEFSRSKREVGVVSLLQEPSNNTCHVGGAIGCNETDEGPCVLMCLDKNIQITIINTTINTTTNSSITSNATFSAFDNCTLNAIASGNDGLFDGPYVDIIFGDCSVDSDIDINTVNLTFYFPTNISSNQSLSSNLSLSASQWAIVIVATIEATIEDSTVDIEPVTLKRFPGFGSLYTKFAIPTGLSYACTAPSYNEYSGTSISNSTNVSVLLMLGGIKVQPYQISNNSYTYSFASADNCIGYFTHATWMGIFCAVLMIIIIYIATLCAFSINTLDKFEDPRGKTISVEKLH